jgi:hypothetical protein
MMTQYPGIIFRGYELSNETIYIRGPLGVLLTRNLHATGMTGSMGLPVGSSREIEGNRSSTVALVSRRYNAREGIFICSTIPTSG